MEPFENDELSQAELDAVLKQWQSPEPPARLKAAVFPEAAPWWRRVWGFSIPLPLPVACGIAAMIAVGAWLIPRPAPAPRQPEVVVRTERVEVPVEHERVVTRYVYRNAPSHALTFEELKPVAELRPRIIRSGDGHN
jgi:hypothetical protein